MKEVGKKGRLSASSNDDEINETALQELRVSMSLSNRPRTRDSEGNELAVNDLRLSIAVPIPAGQDSTGIFSEP